MNDHVDGKPMGQRIFGLLARIQEENENKDDLDVRKRHDREFKMKLEKEFNDNTETKMNSIGSSLSDDTVRVDGHNMEHQKLSLENVRKQKDEEVEKLEKLRDQIEEQAKEMDELKQLYVKECTEKEHILKEKEKLEKQFFALSARFKMLKEKYSNLEEEKEELVITLIGINKEMATNQIHNKSLEKEIEELENKLKMRDHQKEMISKLKVDLDQYKKKVLSAEKRFQFCVDSKTASYKDQLNELKRQYDEKVDELKQAKKTIFKLKNLDLQTSTKVIDKENIIKSNVSCCEKLFINIERKHKVSMNELTLNYKNELKDQEMIFNNILNKEKNTLVKMIEALKLKHIIEIETLNDLAKKNVADYPNQEFIKIVIDYKKLNEKLNATVTSKNHNIKELEKEISIKNSELEQLKKLLPSSSDVDKLEIQIKEERSEFSRAMTNQTEEMHQIKDRLSTSLVEVKKLQTKCAKLKRVALNYQYANQKQQLIFNELLTNLACFFDNVKGKTDQIILNKENNV